MTIIEDELTILTDAHSKVIRMLERRGIELMEEVDFPPYRVDIYLPDYHAVIEVNGPRHEKKTDWKRVDELEKEYKLHVLILTTDMPIKSQIFLVNQFLSAVDMEYVEKRLQTAIMRAPWL